MVNAVSLPGVKITTLQSVSVARLLTLMCRSCTVVSDVMNKWSKSFDERPHHRGGFFHGDNII